MRGRRTASHRSRVSAVSQDGDLEATVPLCLTKLTAPQAPSSASICSPNPLSEGQNGKTEAPRRRVPELKYYFIIAKGLFRFKHPPCPLHDVHSPDTPRASRHLLGKMGPEVPRPNLQPSPQEVPPPTPPLLLAPLTLTGSPFRFHDMAFVRPLKTSPQQTRGLSGGFSQRSKPCLH